MPGLMAVIGGDADPLRKELTDVERMAARAGVVIKANLTAGHLPGQSLVMRETLVLLREIGRGNWSRVPGSFTRLLEGLNMMKEKIPILGFIFSRLGAAIGIAIAGIVSGFLIWEYRVKSLAKELAGLKFPDLKPPDLSTLQKYQDVWRGIAAAVNEASDKAVDANAAFEQTKTLMEEQHDAEKKLLELDKEKALAKARNNPAREAQIRADFAKKEHDLEKQQMDDEVRAKAKQVSDLNKEAYAKAHAANRIKVATKKEDEEAIKTLREYGKGYNEAEDVDLIADLTRQSKLIGITGRKLLPEDAARLSAARGRVDDFNRGKKQADELERAQKERDALRERQKQLESEAKSAAGDEIKERQALENMIQLNQQKLSNDDRIRAAEDKLADMRDTHSTFTHGTVNAVQQVGAYAVAAAHVDVAKKTLQHVAHIDNKLDKLGGGVGQGGFNRANYG